jgi:thiamine kinase-like enzyme
LSSNRIGDDRTYRLLSYIISKEIVSPHAQILPIKPDKWQIVDREVYWFVKIFSSIEKRNAQIKLTEKLSEGCSTFTYRFHPKHHSDPLIFENEAVGVIEWIDAKKSFSYQTFEEREEALSQINAFHQYTIDPLLWEERSFHSPSIWDKYLKRWDNIKINSILIQPHLPEKHFQFYLAWSKWCMNEAAIRQENIKEDNTKELCMNHGDVAHHNFLRRTNGELAIIDFDLAHIAPAKNDYIQFSNRILPHIHYSYQRLMKHGLIQRYQNDPFFHLALLFPSDIWREWNQFIRYPTDQVLTQLKNLSIVPFQKRIEWTITVYKRYQMLIQSTNVDVKFR